jgi:cysteine desulfuration protein SufE
VVNGTALHKTNGVILAKRQQELIDRYAIIEDAQERFAAVTNRGRKLPPLSDAERVDTNLVPGCSSRVWLAKDFADGHCRFRVDADSPIVKGLAALLCELYDNAPPSDIVAWESEQDILEGLRIERMLSPTRLNGLASIRAAIRAFAAQHT